jgi:hypothetical protein
MLPLSRRMSDREWPEERLYGPSVKAAARRLIDPFQPVALSENSRSTLGRDRGRRPWFGQISSFVPSSITWSDGMLK